MSLGDMFLAERIFNVEKKKFNEIVDKVIFEGDKTKSDYAFYIIARHLIYNMYKSKLCLPIKEYMKQMFLLHEFFTVKILNYDLKRKVTKEKVRKEFDLEYILPLAYNDFYNRGLLVTLNPEIELRYVAEYLYYRYMEKERISNKYIKEIRLLFDIENEHILRDIKVLALSKVRNVKFPTVFKKLNRKGNVVHLYLKKLAEVDPILARILEDMRAIITEEGLARFIYLYQGSKFEIPRIRKILDMECF